MCQLRSNITLANNFGQSLIKWNSLVYRQDLKYILE